MTDTEKIREIKAILKICDEAVEEQKKYGSEYGIKCAKEVAFEHICDIMKEADNG